MQMALSPNAGFGDMTQIDLPSSADGLSPTVSERADGTLLVTWDTGDPDDPTGISVLTLDSQGIVIQPEFTLPRDIGVRDTLVYSITSLANGDILVARGSAEVGGRDVQITTQRYDSTGAVVGPETVVLMLEGEDDDSYLKLIYAEEYTNPYVAKLDIAALPDGGYVLAAVNRFPYVENEDLRYPGIRTDVDLYFVQPDGSMISVYVPHPSFYYGRALRDVSVSYLDSGEIVLFMEIEDDYYGATMVTYTSDGTLLSDRSVGFNEDLLSTYEVQSIDEQTFIVFSPDGVVYYATEEIKIGIATVDDASAFRRLVIFNYDDSAYGVIGDEDYTLDVMVQDDGSLLVFLLVDGQSNAVLRRVTTDGQQIGDDVLLPIDGTLVDAKLLPGDEGETAQLRLEMLDADGNVDLVFVDLALVSDLSGTSGDDDIVGTVGDDVIGGQEGEDTLRGDDGDDTIQGDEGDDQIYGEGGSDLIYGNDGSDTLLGGAGHDTLYGGLDDDELSGGTGADDLHGGDGDDTLYGNSSTDELHGDAGDDYLAGGIGADTLYGGDGDDELYGNTGVDEIYGDDGDDYISTGNGADYAEGGAGDDYLIGRTGWDTLYGGEGNDTLLGSEGVDQLYGDEGNDYLSGGSGEDLLFGDAGNDILYGNFGSDYLDGGTGDDALYGGTGDDTLYGDAGDDTIQGNQGLDVIIGGTGDDDLRGGTLADTFVFDQGHDHDTISDFEISQDILSLSSDLTGGVTDVTDIIDAFGMINNAGEVVLDFGAGDSITFSNLTTFTGLEDNIFVF